MITNNINVNSLINSYLNANKSDTTANKSSVNQTNYSEDSYVPSSKFATSLGIYSKESEVDEEDSISQEEYQRYCGIVRDPDTGAYLLSFPPEGASAAEKRAWIEGMKKLTPEEQFAAKTTMFMYGQAQAFSAGGSTQDYDLITNLYKAITSYQDLFSSLIELDEEAIRNGILGHKLSLEVTKKMRDSFIEHGIK